MITAALSWIPDDRFARALEPLVRSPLVSKILVLVCPDHPPIPEGDIPAHAETLVIDAPWSGRTINRVIAKTTAKYLLWIEPDRQGVLCPGGMERLVEAAEATAAGMVYADYADHPVNDYQLGSIRDTFDFGPVLLFNLKAVRRCLRRHGAVPKVRYAGLYDLRLKLSLNNRFFHIAESLSTPGSNDMDASATKGHFAYVDPRNRSFQSDMEDVATEHLKRLGAFLTPDFLPLPVSCTSFPVEASVIIPVRNRVRTIGDAVKSALSQKTDFPFNIIVVENHSTDGTDRILKPLARQHPAVHPLVPAREDLGIGGCWQEAVQSPLCGRYAVQLDSDDLYSGPDTLQRLVDRLREDHYAMVVGSYTIVNEKMQEIPPCLIDHREWTDANGRNNALRINGLGAPRAFHTELIRQIGFPNVSYGEDYAAALRLSRYYRIGRIYDSLYLCRRWAGNTDAALSVTQANRYDAYKDMLRTMEILARRQIHREKS